MKKTFKFLSILFVGIGLMTTNSCETMELDITENPNALPLTASDPDLLLNGVQVDFAYAMEEFGKAGSEVTRLSYMYGRNYQNAYGPTYFNNSWRLVYQKVLKNIQVMNVIAKEKGLKKHIAMGQVLEAYSMVTVVDYFGDVPYTEALNSANLFPKKDKGTDVYTKALTLLDDAIANFNATAPALPTKDFYYNRDWAKWIRLANSIKLKIYLQSRLVNTTAITSFNTIIASNNFIKAGEDFEFNYGVSNTNPDSRHPQYVDSYSTTGVTDIGFYQSNWLMNEMINGKTVRDPRLRFYFYRQVNNVVVNEQVLRCSVEPAPAHYVTGNYPYCILANNTGYWGRDHGNDEGIPPDTQRRTAPGVYPAGGRFDGDNFASINTITMGARGNGVTPILLASTIDFWRAEATFFGGTGSARQLMLDGVQKSFTKVRGFVSRDATALTAFVPATSVDTDYLTAIGAKYDAAAATTAARLDVIVTEMFISLYGNGIDAYNAYRRTGSPRSLQPNIEPNPGAFIRSFQYPANEANTNPNVGQKPDVKVQVFWDTNPATGFLVGN